MNEQIRREHKALAAVLLAVSGVAALWYFATSVDSLESISSRQIDDMLYSQLDEYSQAYAQNQRLSTIFETAMTDPEELTPRDREIFLAQERKFLSGWEAAWLYKDDGVFDPHRYSVWNSWYVDEFKRRPPFTWTENRKYFSEAFAEHVDRSVGGSSATQ